MRQTRKGPSQEDRNMWYLAVVITLVGVMGSVAGCRRDSGQVSQ